MISAKKRTADDLQFVAATCIEAKLRCGSPRPVNTFWIQSMPKRLPYISRSSRHSSARRAVTPRTPPARSGPRWRAGVSLPEPLQLAAVLVELAAVLLPRLGRPLLDEALVGELAPGALYLLDELVALHADPLGRLLRVEGVGGQDL